MSKSVQKIKVKNFRALKDVEIEVNDLVILLGEQASGKSTLSKLIYFFKSLRYEFVDQIYNGLDDKTNFELSFSSRVFRKFTNYFGRTYFEDFKIVYTYGEKKHLTIQSSTNKEQLSLHFDDDNFRLSLFSTEIKQYINTVQQHSLQETAFQRTAFQRALHNLEKFVEELFNDALSPLYIPAGRSVTVNFPEQFKLNFYGEIRSEITRTNKTPQDDLHLMNQFIKHVERIRGQFKGTQFEGLISTQIMLMGEDSVDKNTLNIIVKSFQKVLRGRYVHEADGEKVFMDDNSFTYLNNASSGQQEAIRILQDAFLILLENQQVFRVIEEPEAHLYPMAQKHLIEVLATVLNHTDSQIIITTHSPYILSIVNNLLFATRVAAKNPDAVSDVENVVPRLSWLDPEKTNIYFLKNGGCESVLDDEVGMIDQNRLDEISEELGADFNRLYEIHGRSFSWTAMPN